MPFGCLFMLISTPCCYAIRLSMMVYYTAPMGDVVAHRFLVVLSSAAPVLYSSIDAWFVYSTSTTLLSFSIVSNAAS